MTGEKKRGPEEKPKGITGGEGIEPTQIKYVSSEDELLSEGARLLGDPEGSETRVRGTVGPVNVSIREEMLSFSTRIWNLARELDEESPFRQAVETGTFSRKAAPGSEGKTMPDPQATFRGAIEYISKLEEKGAFTQGMLDRLGDLSDKVHERMLQYFNDELRDFGMVNFEFREMQKLIGPIANGWKLVASESDESKDLPPGQKAYVYSIDFGQGSGRKMALWASAALASRLLYYGSEYRKTADSYRRGVQSIKAQGRIERLDDPGVRDPSLLIDMGRMVGEKGKYVGDKISREIRLLEQREKETVGRMKDHIDRQSMLINQILEIAIGEKKAKEQMKKPVVKKILESLEDYGRGSFNYKLMKEKLSLLRKTLSADGIDLDITTIMDKLVETVSSMRDELDGYRGIDKALGWLTENLEFYADTMKIGDGFLDDDSLAVAMEETGGHYGIVIETFGKRVFRILEEAIKVCQQDDRIEASKLRERLEEALAENDSLAVEAEGYRNQAEFFGEALKRKENDLSSQELYNAQSFVEGRFRKLYSLSLAFDREFSESLPVTTRKVIKPNERGDIVYSIKRLRRLLENMCTVYDTMVQEGTDVEAHGQYLLRPVSEAIGRSFPGHREMFSYIRGELIPFYRDMEGVVGAELERQRGIRDRLSSGP